MQLTVRSITPGKTPWTRTVHADGPAKPSERFTDAHAYELASFTFPIDERLVDDYRVGSTIEVEHWPTPPRFR